MSAPDASDVFLGLGGTVDWELEWSAQQIQHLVDHYSISAADLSTQLPVTSERALLCVLLAHMAAGTGGESFVHSPELIVQFAQRFPYRVTLGGTNIRAATVLRLWQIPSTVHVVAVDATMRRLLPEGVDAIYSQEDTALIPHVIVLYPPRARVVLTDAVVSTTRANRLILANDPPNRDMVFAPEFARAVARARVTVLSTLNVIQDRAILTRRLAQITAAAAERPTQSWLMWEDAAYHNPAYARLVMTAVAPVVDVFGMNEDELQWYIGRDVQLLNAQDMSAALDALQHVLPTRNVIIHSKDWALVMGPDCTRLRSAIECGVTVASTRFELGDAMTGADIERMRHTPQEKASQDFCAALEALRPDVACVASFAVDVPSPTTIGLGDSFVGGVVKGLLELEDSVQ